MKIIIETDSVGIQRVIEALVLEDSDLDVLNQHDHAKLSPYAIRILRARMALEMGPCDRAKPPGITA